MIDQYTSQLEQPGIRPLKNGWMIRRCGMVHPQTCCACMAHAVIAFIKTPSLGLPRHAHSRDVRSDAKAGIRARETSACVHADSVQRLPTSCVCACIYVCMHARTLCAVTADLSSACGLVISPTVAGAAQELRSLHALHEVKTAHLLLVEPWVCRLHVCRSAACRWAPSNQACRLLGPTCRWGLSFITRIGARSAALQPIKTKFA